MAITKILARKGRLDVGIRYVLNGDKTQEQILTARLNCDPGLECRQMLETKRAVGMEGGIHPMRQGGIHRPCHIAAAQHFHHRKHQCFRHPLPPKCGVAIQRRKAQFTIGVIGGLKARWGGHAAVGRVIGTASFICGTTPMSEWDSYQQKLKDAGIEEAVQMMQEAYDTYMAN